MKSSLYISCRLAMCIPRPFSLLSLPFHGGSHGSCFPHQLCSRDVWPIQPCTLLEMCHIHRAPALFRKGTVNKESTPQSFFCFTFHPSTLSSALEGWFAQILSSCFLLCWPLEGLRHNTTVISACFLLTVLRPFRFNIHICLKSLLHLLSSE